MAIYVIVFVIVHSGVVFLALTNLSMVTAYMLSPLRPQVGRSFTYTQVGLPCPSSCMYSLISIISKLNIIFIIIILLN